MTNIVAPALPAGLVAPFTAHRMRGDIDTMRHARGSDVLVTLYDRPPVSDLRDHWNAEVREIAAVWQQRLGGMTPHPTAPADPMEREHRAVYGDDEDALEQLYRLWAVRQNFTDEQIWVRLNNTTQNLATGEEFDGDPHTLFRYGPLSRGERNQADTLADRYASFEAVKSRLGRKATLCGYYTDTGADLIPTLLGMAGSSVVLKVNKAKYGIDLLDIPAGATGQDVQHTLYDAEHCSGALMHFEAEPEAFFAQEWVQMRFEYRFFIVDGVPVTGAGCVEEYTPANRIPGVPFDFAVRKYRGHLGTEKSAAVAENRRDIVDRYLPFVREAAIELLAEVPELTEYTMDVALGADGNPLIIELNGLPNSGLYATDPSLVVAALMK